MLDGKTIRTMNAGNAKQARLFAFAIGQKACRGYGIRTPGVGKKQGARK